MTDDLLEEEFEEPPEGPEPSPQTHFISRFHGLKAAIGPILTTIIAFLVGGLVVLVTGHNPLKVYQAIFNGTGLNWFFHFGSYQIRLPFSTTKVWFWWDTSSVAAQNLQQTLLLTTPIIFTGLALAFAFRCGMFNIGGQGQYLVGSYFAVWIGSSFAGLSPLLHVVFAVVGAGLAGGAYAGIAGLLKATVGAHEVIVTIMLNWIAIWVGVYLFGQQGPLQNSSQKSIPISNDVVEGAKLPVVWGIKELQGLSIGIILAVSPSWSTRSSSTGRRSASKSAPSASTRRRRATAASVSPATTSSRWASRERSPVSAARATSSAGSTASAPATSRSRRSGSSGSPPRCSGETPPSASASVRSCSAR